MMSKTAETAEPKVESPLLSHAEAAAYLRVPRTWLYDNWRKIGGVKVGNYRMFKVADLDRFIDANYDEPINIEWDL